MFFIAFILFITNNISAATITVTSSEDSGAGTLRQVIIDANDGDEIVFEEDVTAVYFAGVLNIDKNITISGNETNNTIFQDAAVWTDTANKKRFFEVLENAELTLNYLTLKDHTANCSGGAIVNRGSLTVNNCTFNNNRAFDVAGAIFSYGILNISNSVFSNNYGPRDIGAIYSESILTIENSIFSNNYGAQGSGAIRAFGEIKITNSNFTGNYTTKVSSGNLYSAGAIYIDSNVTDAYISNCIFEENIASEGGAVCNWGMVNIDNCIFKGNKATNAGAISNHNQITVSNSTFLQNEADSNGIFDSSSYTLSGVTTYANSALINCLFTDNTMTSASSHSIINSFGVTNDAGLLTLINCTVANNTATGISQLRTNMTMYNTVLWNNVSKFNDRYDVYRDMNNDSGTEIFTAHNCLIGTGNIDLSLIGANNLVGIDPLLNSDYTLQEESPAIDAGNNTYLPTEITNDLAGKPRISNGMVDMGAYEFQQDNTSVNMLPNDNVKIYVQNRNVIVEDTDAPVQVYSLLGIPVASGTGAGVYPVNDTGVYIVKAGNNSRKIMIQ
jgi:hypothetical protein